MIGVVMWWTRCGKQGSQRNHNCGAPNTRTRSNEFVWTMWNVVPSAALMILLTLTVALMAPSGNAQLYRRPAVSPAMEAYRNRWMAYLKARSTTTTTTPRSHLGVRDASDGNALVINGFQCERPYSFFPNRADPRMYHLCARSRDNWYVYHYFCPQGSLFQESSGKCMQERGLTGNANRVNSHLGTNRRPTNGVTRRTTVAPPPVLRRTTTRATTTTTSTTTTTTTEAPTSSSTTTTEEPEPAPEPDSDHASVTEDQIIAASSSSEEVSTEDEKNIDVMVSVPGPMTSSSQQQSSDEAQEQQQAIHENEASDEVNMIIPESANGSSRLAVTTTAPLTSSTLKAKQKHQMPLKKIPLKAIKATASIVTDEKDESGNSSETAVGGRRPRILKKMKYWRDFLVGKQPY